MRTTWNVTKLADAPIEIVDGDRGKNYPQHTDFIDNGFCLFLNAGNVTNSGFSFNNLQFIIAEKDEMLRKGKLHRNDVVLTTRGTIGNAAYYDEKVPFEHVRINSGMVILRCDQNHILPSFVYHYLRSPSFHAQVNAFRSGVAQPQLPIRDMRQIKLPIPTLIEQQRISNVLSAYDDLIENNRRRIQLLEESARLLYKEWFVYLRFPGHEHVKVVDGVPEGWERKPLSELTDYLSRGITPHYDDEAYGIVINQKCIRNGQIDLSLARRQSKEFTPIRQLLVGDVLINSTGEGTLGRVAQAKSPISNCTVDTHITVVRPKEELGVHYFGMALMALEPLFSTMGRGATNQTELSRAAIGETTILVPAYSLIRDFNEYVHPTYQQISTITIQNQKLRQARDLLLPRLMNGVIEV